MRGCLGWARRRWLFAPLMPPGRKAGSRVGCCSSTCTATTTAGSSRVSCWMRRCGRWEFLVSASRRGLSSGRAVPIGAGANQRSGAGHRGQRLSRHAGAAADPGPGPHRVIITSRHILAGLGARLLDVTVQAAAIALLEKVVRAARPADDRIGGDPAAGGRLARGCGGLPLALHITAALLVADPSLTAAELARVHGSSLGIAEQCRSSARGIPGAVRVIRSTASGFRRPRSRCRGQRAVRPGGH